MSKFIKRLKDLKGKIRSLLVYDLFYYYKSRRIANLWRSLHPHVNLAFDIGAHRGSHVRALHRLDSRIIAVEPHPYFARSISRKFKGINTITVENCAIADQTGKMKLKISSAYPTVSTLDDEFIQEAHTSKIRSWEKVNWDKTVEVDTKTLNFLIQTYGTPDLLKIDVEGFEYQVLQTLQHPIDLIIFEYLPPFIERAKMCINFLSNLGTYVYNLSEKGSYQLSLEQFVNKQVLLDRLSSIDPVDNPGDIYARKIK